MQNNTNDRVTPLKLEALRRARIRKTPNLMEAATAPSRPKSGLTRALGSRLLWAAMGLAVILLLILIYYRNTRWNSRTSPR